MSESEYGKGLTICLAKFSAHFMQESLHKLSILQKYIDSDAKTRKEMISERPPGHVNFGKEIMNWLRFEINDLMPIWGTPEKLLSHEISMWINGASDHLYDIEVPEGKDWKEIREKVKKLQNDAFAIRGNFKEKNIYTLKDIDALQLLTMEICVLIDKKIGLKDAELGTWS
jgi:hypothetical protein